MLSLTLLETNMELNLVIYCLFLYHLQGAKSQTPVISPSPIVNVIERDNLTVTCTYNNTQTHDVLERLVWTTSGIVSVIRYRPNCKSFSKNKKLSTCNYEVATDVYTLQLMLNTSLYNHGDTITCAAHYPNIRSSYTQVFITVPVNTADLIKPTSSEVRVIDGLPLELRCTSKGRPQPIIEWYKQKDTEPEIPIPGGNNTQTSELGTQSELHFYPKRSDIDYKMYCKSYNVDQHVQVISLHKPILNVLYPPIVHSLEAMKKEEGSTVNVSCNIVKGNPESANFRWSHGLQYMSSRATLEINNITKNHSGVYKCVVYNTLKPTFGSVENGSDLESFHLDVLYKSSVKGFYATTFGEIHVYKNITINESDPLNVYCSVDSNPNSNIDITRDGHRIAYATNVVNKTHFVESAACDDAGIYTCTGYNPHIKDQSRDMADVIVYVRCYPRATKAVTNITAAAQNDTVHFNASFMAYPVPREEDYIWRKEQSVSSWFVLESNARINISTGYLMSELTIHEICQSDYGNYSLTVYNNVGKEYGQIFKLVPHEAPGVPENVQVMILKNNEVLCSWRRGFNGGYKQTFVIQLRTDKINWYNITFDLRRNDTSQHCWTILNDIDFDKTYYIRIYSFNIFGKSDIVIGPDLKFVIKSDRVSPTSPSTNKAAIVGGTVGGILVVFIVLIAVVIVRRKATPGLWIFCKKKPTKADNVYYNTAHTRNEVIEDSFRTERRTRPAIIETSSSTDEVNTYEHMIATNPEEKVYSELKHDGAYGTDHDVQEDRSNIYINLRINRTSA